MDKLISIVVPLYNEEEVIDELYTNLNAVLENSHYNFEIILVNDGSQDTTLDKAKALSRRETQKIRLISFSRNFGHQIAITAGIDKAHGDAVVIIDADLQDPPEVILDMIKKWEEGFHVVYGRREKREGEGFMKRFTAALFYRLLGKMTPVEIPADTGDFRLMDRKVVDQLKNMREHSRFVRGMVSWVGFKQCETKYVRKERYAGTTKYPFRKMLRFAMDGIFSFSQLPLKFSTGMGFLCSFISFFFLVYALVIKVFFSGRAIPGWASTFVAILFFGGVQLICVGILGEYLGRIYEEIKGRPLYIIDEEFNA